MTELRTMWAQHRLFRVALILAVLYACTRLALQFFLTDARMLPGQNETSIVPVDLQIYVDAAARLLNHQPLYPTPDKIEVYQYPPAFALAFAPFLYLPPEVMVYLQTLLRIVTYALLVYWWLRIFRRMGAGTMWATTLPLWLVFVDFWSDLGYLNIYMTMALLATLSLEAVLNKRLGWAVLWFSIILQIKPHWAFALAIPLVLGEWRYFVKLLAGIVVVSAGIVGLTLLVVGPTYGWQQHLDYIHLLTILTPTFPWRGLSDGFLGYNHSITQIVVFLLGVSPGTMNLSLIIRLAILSPLLLLAGRQLVFKKHRATGLAWAFALYLGVFIWADMVWEVSLGVALFTYLLAVLEKRWERLIAWIVFLPYALLDIWRLVTYGAATILGFNIMTDSDYVLLDPAIYVPLVMFVILTFYILLLRRMWMANAPLYTDYG
jgi:hypothetical protein